MNINDFGNSKWGRAARDPEVRAKVAQQLPSCSKKVDNRGLVEKAWRLWDYLISGRCSATDVVLIVAALLYLISPIDAVPDVIPVVGWLDDVAIASLVLSYLDSRASNGQGNQYVS
jgi:uncharacterized membrane protein YkvA (DUF1232 family)